MTTFPKPFRLSNAPRPSGSPLRVPFGLKDGRALAPSEVAKGKACGCVCPSCGTPLAAKAHASRKRRPHFAHMAGTDCRTGRETGIHLRAKQLIADRLRLFLPVWDGRQPDMPNPPSGLDIEGVRHDGDRVDVPGKATSLLSAEIEARLEGYVPDILARDDEGGLLIEIRVTHAVGEMKAERIAADGWRILEIDLSGMDRDLAHDPEAFEWTVLEDPAIRHWVFHPGAVASWQQSKAELEERISRRNTEIEEARRANEAAAQRRQETAASAEKQKSARREYMRLRERQPYLDSLARLDGLTDPVRVATLTVELRAAAADRVQVLLAESEPPVRHACLSSHRNGWIYGIDPVLWQLLATRQFVTSREPGYRFNQRDLASWVRRTFPYDRDLYRLFAAQYAKRAEARRAGFAKRHLAFWAFSDEENLRIPDFYAPVNHLVDRWVWTGLVCRLPEPIGQCEVCGPPTSGYRPVAAPGLGGPKDQLDRGRATGQQAG